jgi:hypothetical protein
MNPQFLRIPEPNGPEAQLLRQAAQLPQLSPQLRQQVLTTCGRHIIAGRFIRAAKAAIVTAALLLLAVSVFRYFQPTRPTFAEQQSSGLPSTQTPKTSVSPSSHISAGFSVPPAANPAIQGEFPTPLPKIHQPPDIISNTLQRP